MAVAAAAALPALPRAPASAHHRRRSQAHHRAALPRRGELQGHQEREVKPVVMSWLSEAQRGLLDKHAPERLTLANGRTPKVTYEATGSPHISLRIQELYDVTQTPKIVL